MRYFEVMRTLFIIISLSVLSAVSGLAQNDSVVYCPYTVYEGDTVPFVTLDPTPITTLRFKSKKEEKRYTRIQKKIIKVYPYAKAAGDLMATFEEELNQLEDKKDQKAYIDQVEEEMKERFEGDLRNLTMSEGVILIKLIDRETGDTSFQLIRDLKGTFSAYMWQTMARLFSHNLKDQYNPDEDREDYYIEDIVRRIECGLITVEDKSTGGVSKPNKK